MAQDGSEESRPLDGRLGVLCCISTQCFELLCEGGRSLVRANEPRVLPDLLIECQSAALSSHRLYWPAPGSWTKRSTKAGLAAWSFQPPPLPLGQRLSAIYPHFRDWLKELFAWLKRFQLWSWAFCSSSILWGLGQFLGQFSALPFFRSSCQVPEGDLLSCFAAQLL